jgi:hypothetical protein
MSQLDQQLQTAIVFAARYTHSRRTAGAYAIIYTIRAHWDQLSEVTHKMLVKESYEASANRQDWQDFRDFAENWNSSAS